jgi:hypothetical protein
MYAARIRSTDSRSGGHAPALGPPEPSPQRPCCAGTPQLPLPPLAAATASPYSLDVNPLHLNLLGE